jgi:hypothetical protein
MEVFFSHHEVTKDDLVKPLAYNMNNVAGEKDFCTTEKKD